MKQTVTITGENMNVVVTNAVTTPVVTGVKTKAQKRMDALRAAGFDISKFFTFGNNEIIEIKDGNAVPVDFDKLVESGDVVEKSLVEGGYINNWSLFRRWVMAQMFRMLRDMEQYGKSFNYVLQHNGYEYQWGLLERELHAQAKMLKHGDNENYNARHRWFNNRTAHDMANDYIQKLRKYIEDKLMFRHRKSGQKVYKHKCKGNPYIRLQNNDIFIADLRKKVYLPLEEMANAMKYAEDVNTLYNLVVKFNKTRKHLQWNTKHNNSFINAFKGSGAYFTMRNLVMFHEARFLDMTESESLSHIEETAREYSKNDEGWRMMGVLKQLVYDSNISIQGKMNEWKK